MSDLFVAGSLALDDYIPAVSDIDLVAVTDAPLDRARQQSLTALHRDVDERSSNARLGCIYVQEGRLTDHHARHPTWTHGTFVRRGLSGITRAELTCHGFAVFGRDPRSLLPAMSVEEVRAAARAEVLGYWASASRRPWMWLNPEIADLGLVSMARARYTIQTGRLLTKTSAVEHVRAPEWLVDDVRARRTGEHFASPRLRTAWFAWRDTRRTCRTLASAG